ncbi:MAG: nucleotidyltransferase family protein [Rhizonema sp. PD37]|nr:nucleotidyltransferase family protein [Rhizonema sp. PD37]
MSDRIFHRSYRLTPAQALLLQAVLLKGQAALSAWEQWQSEVDIEILDANSYVLLPQLYQNLLTHDVEHPHMARLKGIYRHTWYANQLKLKQLKILTSHLKDVGIETLLFGDAALYACQTENYRLMSNFHLLVHSAELESAVKQLTCLDWQISGVISQESIHLQNDRSDSLYLQGRLFWAIPQDYTDEKVWQYATFIEGDLTGWMLSPTDQLLDGCVKTFFKNRSRQIHGIADALILIQKSGNDLDWMRLITQAQRYQMILPVRNMLILLQQVLQLRAPSWVLPALFQMPISQAEWQNYQVLAGDRQSFVRSTLTPLLNYLENRLLYLGHRPFPGRGILKSFLRSRKSALEWLRKCSLI